MERSPLGRCADDPRRLTFIERWASRDALEAHLVSPQVKDVLARAEDLFGDSAEIVVYEALPGGQTRKGSLAEHAGG